MDFFIIINGQQAGPFTIAQLAEMKITSETLVWREGMKDWQPAWMVSELRYILEENARSQFNSSQAATNNASNIQGFAVPPVPPVNQAGNQTGDNQSGFQANSRQAGFQTGREQGYNMGFPPGGTQSSDPKGTSENKKPKKFFTFKIFGILILLLLLIMAVTNPSKEAHENAIRTEVSKAIDKTTSSTGDDIFSQGFGMVARMIAGNFLDSALDNLFEYHNYILFSKGTVTINEKSHTVSYGIFSKVITMNADDMVKAIENNEGKSDAENDVDSNDKGVDESTANESSLDESSSSDESSTSSDNSTLDGSSNSDNSSNEGSLQQRLEDKANKAVDKMVDKASKKVEDRINKKLEEMTDSSTFEKWIDKILEMF